MDKEAGYKTGPTDKGHDKETHTPGVLSSIGGFQACFSWILRPIKSLCWCLVPWSRTKLRIAFMMDKHDTIGEDCVTMCVNDILCQGAKPLFFLDYIATGKLIPEKMAKIVEGVANGCIKAGGSPN